MEDTAADKVRSQIDRGGTIRLTEVVTVISPSTFDHLQTPDTGSQHNLTSLRASEQRGAVICGLGAL